MMNCSFDTPSRVRTWTLLTGEPEFELAGHRGRVCSIVLAGSQRLISRTLDGAVRVWSMEAYDRHNNALPKMYKSTAWPVA